MTSTPAAAGNFPTSFRDPLYSQLSRAAEQKYGLPEGILDAVRTRGERSNHGQTNRHGTRGVYQFIPQTRRGMIEKYKIDPWRSPEEMTEAAALHLRDDHKATGSWNTAITRYHGGPDPRNWGPRTRAYGPRVGNFDRR
jgi:soluble lytic murein transglycosylase-like protein